MHEQQDKHRINSDNSSGSQSGRLLRTWVNDDFNVDEKNREIFDGISNWVSGSSRGQFNQYFGQPSVAFPHLSPIQFPFTITESVDPATDHIGSLHENIDKRKSKLKVFYINTSIEYHRGDASLLHTSLNGEKDIPISSNSRVYLLCGCPHNPMPDWPPSFANGLKNNIYIQQNYYIPVHLSPFYRAQLLLLTKWITQSIEPPKSIYPTLKSNSLVLHEKVYQWFQSIPNSNPPENKSISRLWRRDFGYSFNDVPSIDENGNDVDGILLPHIVVPLATYTGWALRHPNFGGEWKIMMISGSLIPFSITKSMRLLSNDPRLSIEERYTTKEQYLNKTNEATLDLIQKQFLLEEDLQSIILFSSKLWDWIYSL
ncbi:unnamed protein product [Didymodactylos carnosus]|uniref:Alpha/beta hydrolase domain-containing protein n=1 Tax=Didymodactylos carnosus TaxID=1234261 RepID=A0A8S2DR84_9BILA|nr:unnamed protein product [Didymodactylos carnosus]CAF3780456.1 unnamed protein product [Didymodactylos carnosus]